MTDTKETYTDEWGDWLIKKRDGKVRVKILSNATKKWHDMKKIEHARGKEYGLSLKAAKEAEYNALPDDKAKMSFLAKKLGYKQ